MIIFKNIKVQNFFSVGNKPIEICLNDSKLSLIQGHNGSGKCLNPKNTYLKIKAHALGVDIDNYMSLDNIIKFVKEDIWNYNDIMVLTPNGYKEIQNIFLSAPKADIYTIIFDDNTFIETSYDHLLYTENNEFVKIRDLKPNNKIKGYHNYKSIISITKQKKKVDLYDITVDGSEYYANGVLCHNSSIIIDTIYYALYGKSFRKISLSNMINSLNKKNLYVEISFDIGANNYIVKRGIKPNIFEIYINGILKTQTANVREYQEFLSNHILKMDEKTFKQLIIIGSSSYTPFMHLSSADRRTVIEDLLDIDIFSDMLVTLKNDTNNIKQDTTNLYNKKKLLIEKINYSKEGNKQLQQNLQQNIKNQKTKIENIKNNIEDINNNKNELLNEYDKEIIEKINNELNELEQNIIPKINNDISKNNTFKEQSKKARLFFQNNDVCPACTQKISNKIKKEQIEKYDDKIKNLENNINTYNEQINFYKTKFINKKNEIDKLKDIKNKINNYSKELENYKILYNNYINDYKTFINQLKNIENKTNDDIQILENELLVSNNIILEHEKKINSYNIISNMLKDDGIKKYIIKNYLPIIISLIQKYISIIGMNASFYFDESFVETIKMRNRDIFEYNNLSEGERLRIDMAILFSFREFAKMRSTLSTNLLILDEMDRGTLDIEGFSAVKEIISSCEKENIIVISHASEQFLDIADKVIEVNKINNFSSINITKKV